MAWECKGGKLCGSLFCAVNFWLREAGHSEPAGSGLLVVAMLMTAPSELPVAVLVTALFALGAVSCHGIVIIRQ